MNKYFLQQLVLLFVICSAALNAQVVFDNFDASVKDNLYRVSRENNKYAIADDSLAKKEGRASLNVKALIDSVHRSGSYIQLFHNVKAGSYLNFSSSDSLSIWIKVNKAPAHPENLVFRVHLTDQPSASDNPEDYIFETPTILDAVHGWMQLKIPLRVRNQNGTNAPDSTGFILAPESWGSTFTRNNNKLDLNKIVGYSIGVVTSGWTDNESIYLPKDSVDVNFDSFECNISSVQADTLTSVLDNFDSSVNDGVFKVYSEGKGNGTISDDLLTKKEGRASLNVRAVIDSVHNFGSYVQLSHNVTAGSYLDFSSSDSLSIWIKVNKAPAHPENMVLRIQLADQPSATDNKEEYIFEAPTILDAVHDWVQLKIPLRVRNQNGENIPDSTGFILPPTSWDTASFKHNNSKLDLNKIVGYSIGIVTSGWTGEDKSVYLPKDSVDVNFDSFERNTSVPVPVDPRTTVLDNFDASVNDGAFKIYSEGKGKGTISDDLLTKKEGRASLNVRAVIDSVHAYGSYVQLAHNLVAGSYLDFSSGDSLSIWIRVNEAPVYPENLVLRIQLADQPLATDNKEEYIFETPTILDAVHDWVQLNIPLRVRNQTGEVVPDSTGFILAPTSWGPTFKHNNSKLDPDKIVSYSIGIVTSGWVNSGLLPKDSVDVNFDSFVLIRKGSPTGIEKVAGASVSSYSVSQNYPNPFNPTTNIKYSIAKPGIVSLKIFDVIGKEVAVLVNQDQTAGTYHVQFDASHLSSGIYFYKLQSGDFTSVNKMMLIK
ncbi:MAG: T9SS type A sorting domain-containing protein [Ignavibacteria bacterium]